MRCCELVFDRTTKRKRKCKLTQYYDSFCYHHTNKLFRVPITMIQSLWRGYYLRKKINKLLIPLPREIQDIVLHYVRYDYNLAKYLYPIYNKIYKCIYFKHEYKLVIAFTDYEDGLITKEQYTDFFNNIKKLKDDISKKSDILDKYIKYFRPKYRLDLFS